MNLEHHHRRIHWKTRLLRWSLAPLALAAGPAWLYFSLGPCMEDGDAAGSVCRAYRVIPFLPSLLALAVAGLIVYDLVEVGREVHLETHGVKPRRHLKHAHHGYKALDHHHRHKVRRAAWNWLAVTAAVALWIAWKAWQTTR